MPGTEAPGVGLQDWADSGKQDGENTHVKLE
jgi:hypothetical protein